MSSQAWGSHCFGPQKGVPGNNGKEYVVETSGLLMTRKPKRKEKKPRTSALPLFHIGIP